MINRTHLNIVGQIIRYMDLTVKGNFRTYLKKLKQQMTYISLDETPFNSEKKNKNVKTRLDYIESGQLYNTMDKNSFSDKMMEILKTLSNDDFSFIILKFQEEYSNEELANHFHLTTEEVEEREIRILSLLKGNPSIQKLKKIK